MAHINSHALAPNLQPKLRYNVERDFTPIMLVGVTPDLLLANKNQTARSVGDIVAKGHPSVPTMSELGFEGFDATTSYGLAGPGKLSPAIVAKISRDANAMLAMPDVQEKLDTYGAEDGGGSPEKFAEFIRNETAKWAKVVKDAEVKIDS